LVIGGLAANKKHKHRLVPKQRLAICWRYGTGPWQWNNHNNHMGWFLRQTINRKTWGLSYRFWNSGSFLTNFWLEESHLDCGHFLLLCLAEKWLTSWDSPKLGTHPMVLRCFYLRVPYIYILLYLIDSMCSNRFQPYIPHTYIYIYPSMCSNRIPTASHGSFSLWKLIQPLGLSRVSRVPHFQTPPGIIFFVSYGKHNPMKIAITLW
jgi:hypothetical protein